SRGPFSWRPCRLEHTDPAAVDRATIDSRPRFEAAVGIVRVIAAELNRRIVARDVEVSERDGSVMVGEYERRILIEKQRLAVSNGSERNDPRSCEVPFGLGPARGLHVDAVRSKCDGRILRPRTGNQTGCRHCDPREGPPSPVTNRLLHMLLSCVLYASSRFASMQTSG